MNLDTNHLECTRNLDGTGITGTRRLSRAGSEDTGKLPSKTRPTRRFSRLCANATYMIMDVFITLRDVNMDSLFGYTSCPIQTNPQRELMSPRDETLVAMVVFLKHGGVPVL